MTIADFPSASGAPSRPARTDTSSRKPWAQNPSAPGADDGTILDATLLNDLVGLLRGICVAAGTAQTPGDDAALATAIDALAAIRCTDLLNAVGGIPEASVAGLVADLAALAPKASPVLTGTPTAPNNTAGNNSTRIANTAYVDAAIGAIGGVVSGALLFKGPWDASTGAFPGGGSVLTGYFYLVSVAGTFGGHTYNVGDDVYAIVDNPSTATYAGNWLQIVGGVTLGQIVAALGYTPGALAQLNSITVSLISDASANGRSLIAAGSYSTMRGLLGLGTAALLDVGNTANKIVQLDGSGKLPAVDGSQLVNLPAPSGSPIAPSGRLSLISGNPDITTDQIGKQNLYYVPDKTAAALPVVVSGSFVNEAMLASDTDQVGLTLALAGSANWAANSIHDVFAIMDSGTLKLATRLWDANMYPVETLISAGLGTIITTGTGGGSWANTSAAFDGVTSGASGAPNCRYSTSGGSGLIAWIGKNFGVNKRVSSVKIYSANDNGIRADEPSALQVRIDTSLDGTNWEIVSIAWLNAAVGAVFTLPLNNSIQKDAPYIRVGITCNGVNAVDIIEVEFYEMVAPTAGRRLTHFKGILVNDATMTARTGASTTVSVAQYEGTYLGAAHIDTATAGQITCHVDYGPSRTWGLHNHYNKKKIVLRAGARQTSSSPGSGFTYNITGQQLWTLMQTGFQLEAFTGNPEHPVEALMLRQVYLDAQSANCAYECGIAIDNLFTYSGTGCSTTQDTPGQAIGHAQICRLTIPGYAGIKTLYGIEKGGPSAGVVSLFTDCRSTVLEASWMG